MKNFKIFLKNDLRYFDAAKSQDHGEKLVQAGPKIEFRKPKKDATTTPHCDSRLQTRVFLFYLSLFLFVQNIYITKI